MSFNNLICNTINGKTTFSSPAQGPDGTVNTSDGLGRFQATNLKIVNSTLFSGGSEIILGDPIKLPTNTSALCPDTANLSTYQFKSVTGTANIIASGTLAVLNTVEYTVVKIGRQVTWVFGTEGTISYSGLPMGQYAIIDLVVPNEFRPFGSIRCNAYIDADVGNADPLTWTASASLQFNLTDGNRFTIINTAESDRSFDLSEMDAWPCTITYISNAD